MAPSLVSTSFPEATCLQTTNFLKRGLEDSGTSKTKSLNLVLEAVIPFKKSLLASQCEIGTSSSGDRLSSDSSNWQDYLVSQSEQKEDRELKVFVDFWITERLGLSVGSSESFFRLVVELFKDSWVHMSSVYRMSSVLLKGLVAF